MHGIDIETIDDYLNKIYLYNVKTSNVLLQDYVAILRHIYTGYKYGKLISSNTFNVKYGYKIDVNTRSKYNIIIESSLFGNDNIEVYIDGSYEYTNNYSLWSGIALSNKYSYDMNLFLQNKLLAKHTFYPMVVSAICDEKTEFRGQFRHDINVRILPER